MTIEQLNEFCKDTFISHLEIEFTDYSPDFVKAKMPVNQKKHQLTGVLHGGASLAMAETVAGAGSMLLVDHRQYNVFGLQISGNHISTISSGYIYATAHIIHQGKSTHIWDVNITDKEDKLISIVRVTNILKKKN